MITIQGTASAAFNNPVTITATKDSKICLVMSGWYCDGSHGLTSQSIAYNGTAMTLHTLNGGYAISSNGVSLWYYLNPPVGAGTIQPAYGNPSDYTYSAITLGNIDQANPIKEVKVGSWSVDGDFTLTHVASDVNGIILTARYKYYYPSGLVGYTGIGYMYYKIATVVNESNTLTAQVANTTYGISASIKSGGLKSGPMHFT